MPGKHQGARFRLRQLPSRAGEAEGRLVKPSGTVRHVIRLNLMPSRRFDARIGVGMTTLPPAWW
jgi:hypothetical protein